MNQLKRILFTVVLACMARTTVIQATPLDFSGYVRTYAGLLTTGDNAYIFLNTFNLNATGSNDKTAFKVNPYVYQAPNEDITIGLREAYMDIFFNTVDIRIGKQQIIWGKADGVFITDIVSPKDLSNFLLPDFDEIRTGITALKLDYYVGDHTFELVAVPIFIPTQIPTANPLWSPSVDFMIPPTFDLSKQTIDAKVENSELFIKYSLMSSAIDFEIMGGTMWDDEPTMHSTKTFDSTHQLSSLTLAPQHHRLGVAGGSFTTTLGPLVLRGEGAVYTGKHFLSHDMTRREGVIEKKYLHYLAGVDFALMDIHFSAQFIQQTILDYEETMLHDQYENTMTILAFKDFLREKLRLELFSYIGLNDQDALVRPKVSYTLTDGFKILLGMDIFMGDEGKFGQYDENDIAYLKIRYDF